MPHVTGRAALHGTALCAAAIAALVVLVVRPLPWGSPRDGTLPACPAVDLRLGQGAPDVPAAAVDCLFGAQADRDGAELQVTTYTDEGEPVHSWYRRQPGHPGLVLMEDLRAGRFGPGGWTVLECPGATALDDLGSCTTRD